MNCILSRNKNSPRTKFDWSQCSSIAQKCTRLCPSAYPRDNWDNLSIHMGWFRIGSVSCCFNQTWHHFIIDYMAADYISFVFTSENLSIQNSFAEYLDFRDTFGKIMLLYKKIRFSNDQLNTWLFRCLTIFHICLMRSNSYMTICSRHTLYFSRHITFVSLQLSMSWRVCIIGPRSGKKTVFVIWNVKWINYQCTVKIFHSNSWLTKKFGQMMEVRTIDRSRHLIFVIVNHKQRLPPKQ